MRIAINISNFLLKNEDWNDMVESLFQQLAVKNSTHEFVFIVGELSRQLVLPSNIKKVVLPFPASYGLSFRFWYDYKLPLLLKKEKIDLLINTESVCSLLCSIPQLMLIKDLDFLQSSSEKNEGFIKKRFQKSLKKAQKVIVFDSNTKAELVNKYLLTEEKIFTAHLFANPIFTPMEWQQKEAVKDKFSEGKEFFLYKTDDKNPLDPLILLKAFSLFKKRQQSNMQLLLVGRLGKFSRHFNAKISTYKYRNEVKLLEVLPTTQMADLQAAAYCFFCFSTKLVDFPLLQTMQACVPTIILQPNSGENVENIALYADVNSAESIAEQMKIIYKDENLRSRIISVGLQISAENTIEKSSIQVWTAIEKMMENEF